jgi:hypothetical protein
VRWLGVLAGIVLLTPFDPGPWAATPGPDPVVERIREHGGFAGSPIVVVVGPADLPKSVWQTVKHLVAYRLHRRSESGATVTDAAIYLVRTSDLYHQAATVLRTKAPGRDDVWCRLAGVLRHEAAHDAIDTEREALAAEAAQLRHCLSACQLSPEEVVRLAAYLSTVDGKLRRHTTAAR